MGWRNTGRCPFATRHAPARPSALSSTASDQAKPSNTVPVGRPGPPRAIPGISRVATPDSHGNADLRHHQNTSQKCVKSSSGNGTCLAAGCACDCSGTGRWLGASSLGFPIIPMEAVPGGALGAACLSFYGLVCTGHAEAELQLALSSCGRVRPAALALLFLSEAGLGLFGGLWLPLDAGSGWAGNLGGLVGLASGTGFGGLCGSRRGF